MAVQDQKSLWSQAAGIKLENLESKNLGVEDSVMQLDLSDAALGRGLSNALGTEIH